jgi:hypothetical protein
MAIALHPREGMDTPATHEQQARHVMRRAIATLAPGDPAERARRLTSLFHVRHHAVVHGSRVIGVVDSGELPGEGRIDAHICRRFILVSPITPVSQIQRRAHLAKARYAVVVHGDAVFGIVDLGAPDGS